MIEFKLKEDNINTISTYIGEENLKQGLLRYIDIRCEQICPECVFRKMEKAIPIDECMLIACCLAESFIFENISEKHMVMLSESMLSYLSKKEEFVKF